MTSTHWIVLVLIAAVLLWTLRSRSRRAGGSEIHPESPEWQAALRKAQDAVPLLRQLHAEGRQPILVKYPLENARAEREHVWGVLLDLGADTFRASLETPLLHGGPKTSPPFELPLSALEDWQLTLPDGSIRGGFTIQAEIALAQSQGRRLPPHIAALVGHFVD